MKLPNTKQYYRDLAHYYFTKGKMNSMAFFLGIVNKREYRFSRQDNENWFDLPFNPAVRPERDADGVYIDTYEEN
jgi:hypothetical protein